MKVNITPSVERELCVRCAGHLKFVAKYQADKARPTFTELTTILAPLREAGTGGSGGGDAASLSPSEAPVPASTDDDYSLANIAEWFAHIEWSDYATARDAADRIEALRALAARPEPNEDTARLDWLERTRRNLHNSRDTEDSTGKPTPPELRWCIIPDVPGDAWQECATAREAIDAARKPA